MSKKTVLSILLISLGVITGLLVIFSYTMGGGNLTLALPFLTAAIGFIIAGTILAFSRVLDKFVNPVIDEINKDIQDDMEDLHQRRFTNTFWMILGVGLGGIVFSFFVFRLHKLEAMWGPIPVVLPTFLAIGALAWFIPRTTWFTDKQVYTPMWVFLIPTAGLLFALIFGMGRTENLQLISAPLQESVVYNSYRFSGYAIDGVSSVGLGLDLPSCDGEECLVFLLVVGLIVLTLILVIGSALIPHFWLFSGSIFLGIMALIAIHDLRVRR